MQASGQASIKIIGLTNKHFCKTQIVHPSRVKNKTDPLRLLLKVDVSLRFNFIGSATMLTHRKGAPFVETHTVIV